MSVIELINETKAFVANLTLHGSLSPIDHGEAAYNMHCWNEDGVEYPEGMTPELLAEIWNNMIKKEDITMKRISIDNGATYCTLEEAISGVSWDAIVAMMDCDTCETVHRELTPCSNDQFLTRYLELAHEDLIIG